MATTTKTFTTAGLGTWICPPGVTTVQAEAWGAGGGGGVATPSEGGGGGGAYAIGSSFVVSAGGSYTFQVGASGGVGAAGGSSWFNGTTTVFAPGGLNSAGTPGGAGGTAGIGTPARAGGQGGAGGTAGGGGGGGGASNTGVGGPGVAGGATGGAGGTAGAGAGAGGHGGNSAAAGTAGVAPGGGGGGGGTGANAGAGAVGRVILTYTTPKTASLVDDFSAASFDVTKWGTRGFQPGTINITTGVLNVFDKPSTLQSEMDLDSIETYDLSASSMMVQVIGVTGTQTETQLNYLLPGGNDGLQLKYLNGTLIGNTVVAGAGTNQGTALYDATAMKWWRMRETAGTTYWEYSIDARSWVNLGSIANAITMTSGTIELAAFEGAAVATPGTALFDNVNNPPVVRRTWKTLTGVGQ